MRQACSGHSILVKVTVAAVTDKAQPSETQHKSRSIFACVTIHFGVPGPVATGDSETMFNMAVLRCLRTFPSYHQDGDCGRDWLLVFKVVLLLGGEETGM